MSRYKVIKKINHFKLQTLKLNKLLTNGNIRAFEINENLLKKTNPFSGPEFILFDGNLL